MIGPLDTKVKEFEDKRGHKFKGATRLMKLIALQFELQPRSQELDISFLDSPCTVEWKDWQVRDDVTPLYWACATGQEESALLLIRAGANVNALNTRGKLFNFPAL